MASAITTMAQQQLALIAAVNSIAATTTDGTNTTARPAIGSNMANKSTATAQQISTKQIVDSMMTSQDRVVAATLHNTHFDSNSDNDITNDSGTTSMSTDTGTSYDNSNDGFIVDETAGVGPILDMKAYSRFEPILKKLQVHASDIVRVDNQAIGTGGFAKVYKVMLKGNHLCAAKVSVTVDTVTVSAGNAYAFHILLASTTAHNRNDPYQANVVL
jgi:hypothetical protein